MTSTNTKSCQNTRPYTTFTCNRIQHTALTRNRTYCSTFTRIRPRPLTRACTLTGPRSRNSLPSLYDRTIIRPIFMYPSCPKRSIRFSYCNAFITIRSGLNKLVFRLISRRTYNLRINSPLNYKITFTSCIIIANVAGLVYRRTPTLS